MGYTRCHFFAGIAGWDLALQLARWPENRPVWTGSCPCQPFSAAGKRQGQADSRHLWPEFARLIGECRPPTVIGEQVASAIGHGWLDGVFADLEREGYACGAVVLGAHSIGAPHIRQRLYWVADTGEIGRGRRPCEQGSRRDATERGQEVCDAWGGDGEPDRLADAQCPESRLRDGQEPPAEQRRDRPAIDGDACSVCDGRGWYLQRFSDDFATHCRVCGGTGRLADAQCDGRRFDEPILEPQGRVADGRTGPGTPRLGDTTGNGQRERGRSSASVPDQSGGRSIWSDSRPILCRDGKWRRIPLEPALFPLAHGLPNRVGILRGAGNAICPQTAAEFIRAFIESTS
ncbi:MAG: DNA cytosine methyltransferase [Planctomycetaceae bacterium]